MQKTTKSCLLKVLISFLVSIAIALPARPFGLFKKKSETADLYKVKSVHFHGQTTLSEEFLHFLVKVKPKFKASDEELQQDVARLLETGFFQSANYQLDLLQDRCSVHFHLVEKAPLPEYILQSMAALGNKRTKERVILREITLNKGDAIKPHILIEGLIKLEKLRIFKKVDILFKRPKQPDLPGSINLIVEVEEGMTQVGFVWPTYSTDNPDLGGFGPLGGYVNINFMGTGAWVGLGGIWAKNKVIIGGCFLPHLLGSRQDLSIGLGYGEREQETFNSEFKKTGGEFRILVSGLAAYWNIPMKDNRKILQLFTILDNKFEHIEGKIPSENAWGPLLSTSFAYDTRDDELEPTTGWYPSLRIDGGYYVGEGGDKSFYLRYNPTVKRYFRLGKRHCVAVQIRGGVTNDDIPYLGKYQLGGSNDLRGYPEWSIVGNRYFQTNLEYRFPIFSYRANYGISGVLFYDMGQAWDKGESDIFDKNHSSYGLGLRFLTGPMILRLDYGISPYTDGVYFYFSHLF